MCQGVRPVRPEIEFSMRVYLRRKVYAPGRHMQQLHCVNTENRPLCSHVSYLSFVKKVLKSGRYFFEDQYTGKKYNYYIITSFLYSAVYYLLDSEGQYETLEPSELRKRAFIGDSGVLLRMKEKYNEYREATLIAISEGKGTISDSDKRWINGIKDDLENIVTEMNNVISRYEQT